MIKVCARCGVEFEVKNAAKYCEDCRWFVKRDDNRRWDAAHRELISQRRKEHYRRKKEPADHD